MTASAEQFSDIRQLDAAFHLQALGRRVFMRAPLGVPDWDATEKRILFNWLSGRCQPALQQCTENLERKISDVFGVRYCLAIGSGREAIKLALLGMQLPPGARVILPSFCCLSVLLPVLELGLQPVLADVVEDLQIDPQSVRRIVQPGDRVLIVPHLFGGLADLPQLQQIAAEHGLRLIDDAAQAIGLRSADRWAGSYGDAGIFSFGLFKPLNALGGGALLTNNEKVYRQAQEVMRNAPVINLSKTSVLKTYGKVVWRKTSYRPFLQHRKHQQQQQPNVQSITVAADRSVTKIHPLSAQLASAQLEKISERRQQVQQVADDYAKQLGRCNCLQPPGPSFLPGYPRFVVQLADTLSTARYRELFKAFLQQGIEVQPTYRPLHRILREMGREPMGEFERSETLAERTLCLPLTRRQNISSTIKDITQVLSGFSTITQQEEQPAWP